MAHQAPLKYIFYIAATPEKVWEGFVSGEFNGTSKRLRLAASAGSAAHAIIYVVVSGGSSILWEQSVDGGPPKQVTGFNTEFQSLTSGMLRPSPSFHATFGSDSRQTRYDF